MPLLLKLHAVVQSRLVDNGECDVTDLLHGEHSWLLESFGLKVRHIFGTVTFHSAHPGDVFALNLDVPYIVIQISLLITEGEVTVVEQALLGLLGMVIIDLCLYLVDSGDLVLKRFATGIQLLDFIH